MKNVIFFVVLAILTVAALVGWNAVRNREPNQVAQVQPTGIPTPTMEVGTAVGRSGTSTGSFTTTESTAAGSFADVTKGNSDPNAGVIPTSTPTPSIIAVVANTTPPPANSTVISYTDSGFNPKTLTVKNGTMVKFVNQSSRRMWVASAEVAGGKKLDSMNMGVAVGKDGTYEFQFSQNGTWGFYDQNNQSQNGSVVVN